MRLLRSEARACGVQLEVTEGSRHTKVKIGDRQSTVPRHREINERTAQAILSQMGVER